MVSEMKTLLQAANPDRAKLQRLQRDTFTYRRKWLNSLQNADVLKITTEYPILGYNNFVSMFS